MKRRLLIFIFCFLPLGAFSPLVWGLTTKSILMVDDFNSKKLINRRGGTLGTWKRDPNDHSQWCEISFDDGSFVGADGASLKIDYNIASYMTTHVTHDTRVSSQEEGIHAEGFGGVYMHLRNMNASAYKYLVFSARGDETKGYTRKFKIDIRDKRRTTSVMVEGLTPRWRRYFIPLDQIYSVLNLKELMEIVIVFDRNVTVPVGTIYLDEIYLAEDEIQLEDYHAYLKVMEERKRAEEELPKAPEIPAESESLAERVSAPEDRLKEGSLAAIEASAKQGHLEVRRDEENLVVTTRILFPLDQHVVPATELGNVKKMAELIKQYPRYYVEINGHTDNRGGGKYNFWLSLRRAHAVMDALVRSHGIDANRLSAYGWGLNKPIEPNLTEDGKAKNRRVEFVFKSSATTPCYLALKPPVIDGAANEWPYPENFYLTGQKHLDLGTPTGEKDISARARFQWDYQYLYFHVRVYDSEVVCLKSGRNIFLTDGIELFIDPENDGFFWGNPKDFQIGFSPSSPVYEPQTWSWFQNRKPSRDEVKYSAKLLKDGYEMEGAIAWKFLSEELAESFAMQQVIPSPDEFPLNLTLAVHDLDLNDDSRETKINWRFKKDVNINDHFILGSLTLIKGIQ